MIHFAATVLGRPLDPWQQWLVIHAGEMLDDGRPRFRKVLVIVARQNGKTHLCSVLALFWLFVERWPMVFGTSNKIEYAVDAWKAALDIALATPALAARTHKPRYTNGQNDLPTAHDTHYRIGAANADGGRSKAVDRAIGDELRQQKDWTAYAALTPTMNARPKAQLIYITNMGDSTAVVLNELREDALTYIANPSGDRPSMALFEWSAAPGSHPADMHALAAANPQAGRRVDWESLLTDAASVARPGADQAKLRTFQTEIMCLQVDQMNPAIDPASWMACLDPGSVDQQSRFAACLDISPDLQHASLAVAAPLPDGRVRVEVAAAWEGVDAVPRCRAELRGWVADIRPATLGWFPRGPAAAIDADLRDRRKQGRYLWPPRGTAIAEIRVDLPAVAMGFSQQVTERVVAHSGQALADAQVAGADRAELGVGMWVFTRAGSGHVDAVYAMAGAVHLARTLPAHVGRPRVVLPRRMP